MDIQMPNKMVMKLPMKSEFQDAKDIPIIAITAGIMVR
jgi:hypothetical protein